MKLHLHFCIAIILLSQSSFMIAQLNSPTSITSNAFIDSVYPKQNSTYFPADGTIKIYFSQPMNAATVTSTHVLLFGSLTGKYDYNVIYQSGSNTAEIHPIGSLKHGEIISVTLDSYIQTSTGTNITPFIFTFNVKPEKGSAKFAEADSFQLNFPPTNIVSGDFNNDGKIDVIVSNYDSLKYTVLLNNGAGGFTLGEEMSGVFKPYSISTIDIDNDRDLDLIISTNEENKIRVLRNTGQGIFNWVLPTLDVNAAVAVCPGDFDDDGDNDFVAVTNYAFGDSRAYFYRNDGSGNFSEAGYTSIGYPAALRNIVGDIDNDGDLDILGGTSDYWGVFKILVNDGSGNFSYTGGPYLGPYPDELAGGDFDGDYDLDFVHCSWYMNGISIVLNDGQGGFNDYLNLGNVGGQSRNPAIRDFDGDGDLDFVVVFNSSNVGIAKNNGHPNYELYLSYPISGLKEITAADFDNNGSVDLVGISSTTNQIKFLKNCVDSLVAYWLFDGSITDVSGNVNNGINYGGTFDYDRYGVYDHSIYFDGSTNYTEGMNPGNNLPTGSTPRTISCWIKSNETTVSRNIFHYGTAEAAPTNYHLFMQEGKFVGIGNGYGYGFLQSSKNIGDNTWHFITTVYEGSSSNLQHIYIDGKLDKTDVISYTPNTILTNNWKMGQFMGGSPSLLGNIDDLKIFNFALNNQEILSLYQSSTTAPSLIYPANNSTINTLTLTIDWDSTVTATYYNIFIATDSTFTTIILDENSYKSSYAVGSGLLQPNTEYFWKVRTINDGGLGPWSEVFNFDVNLSSVEDEDQLPSEFALLQNYPNPFNPSTVIRYQLPVSGKVILKVYDILGNEVATLVDEYKSAGNYEVKFRPESSIEHPASGIYFYQLKAGDYIQTKKMILLN